MTTHSSILAWKIPWTKDSDGLHSMGSQKSRTQLSKQQQNNVIKDPAVLRGGQLILRPGNG